MVSLPMKREKYFLQGERRGNERTTTHYSTTTQKTLQYYKGIRRTLLLLLLGWEAAAAAAVAAAKEAKTTVLPSFHSGVGVALFFLFLLQCLCVRTGPVFVCSSVCVAHGKTEICERERERERENSCSPGDFYPLLSLSPRGIFLSRH